MFLKFKMAEDRYRSCYYKLNCKNSRNNVFRRKQETSKVTPKIFRDLEVKQKLRLTFSGANDSMKSKCYVFSGYKKTNDACLMYLECKLRQVKYVWSMHFQVQMVENGRKNIFRDTETTNKVPLKIFRGFEVKEKKRLMFWRPKHSMKGRYYLFSGYKQRNNVCLVYLECKVKEDRDGWYTFKLKWQKTRERTYLKTSKQQTRYRWCFRC